jgi:predicted protein tyrosine phosphatase
MARPPNPKIREPDLVGFKYFKLLGPALEQLHDTACARDKAGNRKLHYDQYIALLLLYFFNPIVTSLRGMQQASQLGKVQRKLGCPRASLGSLSEAARVFDADLLAALVGELAEELPAVTNGRDLNEVRGIVTLVDGTVLSALPKLVRAMWGDAKGKHGIKLHTHFELLKGVPVRMDLTDGDGNERTVLREHLLADRLYVLDRGYAKFQLFADIVRAGSSFVCRVRDNSVYEVLEEREVSPQAQSGEIRRDRIVRFTGEQPRESGMDRPLRLVEIVCAPHRKAQKLARGGPEQGEVLLVATDIMELDAALIALLYKNRWAIETFFRFFKHILGCRHLLSHCQNGIEIQTYVAIIACLLISLWTGRKPTKRTYEMICFYFTGLASPKELLAHIEKLQPQS